MGTPGKSSCHGNRFLDRFIVPVFLTEDSSETTPEPAALEGYGSEETPKWRPTIEVLEDVDSLTFYAAPRRNLSVLFSLTFFTTLWTGIIVALVYSGDAPLLFPIAFGLFDILLIGASLWCWFGSSRLRLEHGAAQVEWSLLGLGSRSSIPFQDITGVDAHITMQSGSTPYYTIRLHTGSRKKHTLGGIREKREAMDLVRRIEQVLENGSV